MPDSASVGSTEVDDELTRLAVPPHAGLFEPLVEDHLATRFGDAAADRVALLLPLGVVHVALVFLQVVQCGCKVLLRPLSVHPDVSAGPLERSPS